MNNKVLISLSALILLLLVIIAAGVYELYNDVPSETDIQDKAVLCEEQDSSVEGGQETQAPEAIKEEPAPVEYPSARQSFMVKNCSTGEMNKLYQNTDNSIELVDHKGKLLWKRNFPDCICGPVAEIDYFSNKKIQFLLAGGKKLYLIDRLGRDVEEFSMDIPFKAVKGPVAVTAKSGKFWKIESEGGDIYLNNKANSILTQLPE